MHGRQILPRLRAGTETELVRTTQGHLHDYSVQVPPGPHVLPCVSQQRAGNMLHAGAQGRRPIVLGFLACVLASICNNLFTLVLLRWPLDSSGFPGVCLSMTCNNFLLVLLEMPPDNSGFLCGAPQPCINAGVACIQLGN